MSTTPGNVLLLLLKSVEFDDDVEMSRNIKLLLEILEISWNLVDAPGKYLIVNVIFTCQAIFSRLYIGSPRVDRITMISGVSIPAK